MNLKSTGRKSKAIDYTKKFEGWLPVAKWDYKQWTNGYGTKAKFSTEVIGTVEAGVRLGAYLDDLFNTIDSYNLPITDSQAIALADFGYNLGGAPLKLQLDRLKAGQSMATVAHYIGLYVNAGGVSQKALITRRDSNKQLLLKKKVL